MGAALHKERQKVILNNFRKAIEDWVMETAFLLNTHIIDQTSAHLNVTIHHCHQSTP